MAVEAVRYARNLCGEVEFSAEDGTRSDIDFLCRITEKVIEAGARIVNIPDTVGYSTPEEYGALIAAIRNRVPNIDKAVLSVHTHKDLGMGVATSLAGKRSPANRMYRQRYRRTRRKRRHGGDCDGHEGPQGSLSV